MNKFMRLATWRVLAADDTATGGSASVAEVATADAAATVDAVEPEERYFGTDAIDAAYEAANADDPTPNPEENDEAEDEEKVADAEPEPKVKSEAEGEQGEPAPTNDGLLAQAEAALLDPETSPEMARTLLTTVSSLHGQTLEEFVAKMLGTPVAQAPAPKPAEATQDDGRWREEGYPSREEYEREVPEYIRAGYESQGELTLARKLESLEQELAPIREERQKTSKERAEAEARQQWEGAIKQIAPRAIRAVEAEVGLKVTVDEAVEAARKFPQLASQPGGLKEAIIANNARKLVAASRTTKEKPPEMPNGTHRNGERAVDPLKDGYEDFADQIASRF